MSLQSGIFNSTEATLTPQGFVRGNKAVDASFFAKIFQSLFTNGVFLTTGGGGFYTYPVYGSVGDASALSVTTASGACHIGGYFAFDDEPLVQTFAQSATDMTYVHRLRLDTTSGEITRAWITCSKLGDLYVATESGEGLPKRADGIYDLLTARVDIPAGATALDDTNITDLRQSDTYCGIVAGAVTEIDTSAWSAQMQAYISSLRAAAEALPEGDIAAFAMNKLNTDLSNLVAPFDAAAMEALASAHTHSADTLADGTLSKGVKAPTGDDSSTFRLRNIAFGSTLAEGAAGIAEGDIWGVLD